MPLTLPRQARSVKPALSRQVSDSSGTSARYSDARGAFGRQARPSVRQRAGAASGRSSMPVPAVTPAATASRGSRVTPRPPATICTSVCRLVAAKAVLAVAVAGQQAADRERLVAQAVAVLQQQQPLAGERRDRDALLRRQAVPVRQRHQEFVARHRRRHRRRRSRRASASSSTSSRFASSRSTSRAVVSSRR